MNIFFKNLFKKKTKTITQNSANRRRTSTRKKVYSRSRKIVKKENNHSLSSSIYSSFIIFAGFISLSVTLFVLIKQLQPIIKNERLKFLCTYQLGDKKSQSYRDAKVELEKFIGDSDKYCKNFLIPKEKNKRGFRFFPLMKDIFFRFL